MLAGNTLIAVADNRNAVSVAQLFQDQAKGSQIRVFTPTYYCDQNGVTFVQVINAKITRYKPKSISTYKLSTGDIFSALNSLRVYLNTNPANPQPAKDVMWKALEVFYSMNGRYGRSINSDDRHVPLQQAILLGAPNLSSINIESADSGGVSAISDGICTFENIDKFIALSQTQRVKKSVNHHMRKHGATYRQPERIPHILPYNEPDHSYEYSRVERPITKQNFSDNVSIDFITVSATSEQTFGITTDTGTGYYIITNHLDTQFITSRGLLIAE